MTPERWQTVKAVLQATLERPLDQQALFLEQACGTDAELRQEVESLLAAAGPADSLDALVDPLIGERVGGGPAETLGRIRAALAGRYGVEREIGHGGMATVYLAHDLKLSRRVALKILHPDLGPTLGTERFLREIATASRLSHPNILALHDSGEADGRLFYAMPYVEGESLRQRLERESQLPVDETIRILTAVAGALDYAHRAGVVHRDIKPENILLATASGGNRSHPLVADFGIARALDAAGGERLTQTGLALGTPAYMSPEQAAGGGRLDERSDIYALGCVAYEMLAGTTPFTGPTAQAILARHAVDPVPPLRTLRPTVPPAVAFAIERALAKVPADRFATAVEFAEALHATAPAPPTGPNAGIRRLRLRIAGALGALAVLAGLAGVLWRVRPPALAPHRVAVASFENRTGQADLDNLGALAADLILRALMETQLVDVSDLEAVNVGGRDDSGRPADPRAQAKRARAGLLVLGNYYRSRDSVTFHASVVDVATGRNLRSLEPVIGPIEQSGSALEALRQRVAGVLGLLLDPMTESFHVDPDMAPPQNLPAYRELVAGLRLEKRNDFPGAAERYRRALELDSTFLAPLIQLAHVSAWSDRCGVTDSIGDILRSRQDRLSTWNRLTIGLLLARCQGDQMTAVKLHQQRFQAFPQSKDALSRYIWVLQHSNQPRAARDVIRKLDPERDLGWLPPGEAQRWYWGRMGELDHTLGDYQAELESTDRWRDSADWEWVTSRGRALSALGRDREVLALLGAMPHASVDSVAAYHLGLATELAVHQRPAAATTVARNILARLEVEPGVDPTRVWYTAWANRLLGRDEPERVALEEMVRSVEDTIMRLDALGRIAVIVADTAGALRIDSILAERSDRRLLHPEERGHSILLRARIAAGLGRREQAIALLRSAGTRGLLPNGSSYAFHEDLRLRAALRGYPPFEALLKPDN
jgi:serine/threonine-protein kinase